jgi:acyl-CoA synthetase (AMP-forming)/AMP-acid ligase II
VQLGVEPETRVVIYAPNSRDWMIAYYGPSNAGAVVVLRDAGLPPGCSLVLLTGECPGPFGLPISLEGIVRGGHYHSL